MTNSVVKRKWRWKEALFSNNRDVACSYCNEKLTKETLTLDHKVPISRGGGEEVSNYVPSCAPCNRKKAQHLLYGMSLQEAINFRLTAFFNALATQEQRYKYMKPSDDTEFYKNREHSGRTANGIFYCTDLCGSEGVHLHLWIGNHGVHSQAVYDALQEMKRARDVVSWSYSRCLPKSC